MNRIVRPAHEFPEKVEISLAVLERLHRLLLHGDVLDQSGNSRDTFLHFNSGCGNRNGSMPTVLAGNFPFFTPEIFSGSHAFHALNRLHSNIGIGIQRLVPAEPVDFLHRVSGNFRHPVVPDRKVNERKVGHREADTNAFGCGSNDGFSKIAEFLDCLIRFFSCGDITKNP